MKRELRIVKGEYLGRPALIIEEKSGKEWEAFVAFSVEHILHGTDPLGDVQRELDVLKIDWGYDVSSVYPRSIEDLLKIAG